MKMPANYIVLDQEEMTYLDGGNQIVSMVAFGINTVISVYMTAQAIRIMQTYEKGEDYNAFKAYRQARKEYAMTSTGRTLSYVSLGVGLVNLAVSAGEWVAASDFNLKDMFKKKDEE